MTILLWANLAIEKYRNQSKIVIVETTREMSANGIVLENE